MPVCLAGPRAPACGHRGMERASFYQFAERFKLRALSRAVNTAGGADDKAAVARELGALLLGCLQCFLQTSLCSRCATSVVFFCGRRAERAEPGSRSARVLAARVLPPTRTPRRRAHAAVPNVALSRGVSRGTWRAPGRARQGRGTGAGHTRLATLRNTISPISISLPFATRSHARAIVLRGGAGVTCYQGHL